MTDQYECRLEKLHDVIVKERCTADKSKETLERNILELELSLARIKSERDELTFKLNNTVAELNLSRASQQSL